ncbi:MAG: hypothetical protein HXY20_06265 [Acidobacteria bacterium]|nr:hypothetical protein [Acidobacteriota bacterium]
MRGRRVDLRIQARTCSKTNLDAFSQVFSTIPVLIDEASTTLYFPQVADGGTYRTNFILLNPGTSPATARLEFYDDDGNPLGLPIGGLVRTSHEVQLSSRGAARFLTDGTSTSVKVGWVKVTCPTAIGGSSIFQTLNGNVITSEAGVASSPYLSRFTVYVETAGSAWSGLAICNPGSSAVDVTLKLRDSSGAQRDTFILRLPARGHVARFFTQWFGDYPNFEGTLEVVSSTPVSGVALRYDNPGLTVFATLPVVAIQ